MRPSLALPFALLAIAGVASLAVRSDAQVSSTDILNVKEFVTSGLRNVTTSDTTLVSAPVKRITYVTDLVVDNRNAFAVVVTFTRDNDEMVSVSVPADDTRALHFQTGFELRSGETFEASATANVKVTANAFRVKE
jgi:hypothetical protein